MEKKTFIDKIKAMFTEVESEEIVENEFIEAVTEDGVTLRIKEEGISEGVEVFIVGEDGEEAIAPDAEYSVEGKVITITEGKISEVKDIEVEETEETEEVIEEEMETEVEVKSEEIEEELELEAEVEVKSEEEVIEEEVIEEEVEETELEKRLTALEKAIADISENMSTVEKLSSIVSEIADLPADLEVKLSKIEGSDKKNKITNREEKLNFFSKRK